MCMQVPNMTKHPTLVVAVDAAFVVKHRPRLLTSVAAVTARVEEARKAVVAIDDEITELLLKRGVALDNLAAGLLAITAVQTVLSESRSACRCSPISDSHLVLYALTSSPSVNLYQNYTQSNKT